jgi:uncharacterized protein YbjT (DUF2867 family)
LRPSAAALGADKTVGLRALIGGATGLTGGALVAQLLTHRDFTQIVSIERRASTEAAPSKLSRVVADFDALPTLPPVDVAFCCLGTTMKRAGSAEAFRRVDFDYVVAFARATRAAGARQFIVISALGASTRSRAFYNRVKGEMEDAVAAMDFDSLCIMRPSLLVGARDEVRVAERLGIVAASVISPFLHGGWRKYRSIPAAIVARAMIATALAQEPGIEVLESDEIVERAKD